MSKLEKLSLMIDDVKDDLPINISEVHQLILTLADLLSPESENRIYIKLPDKSFVTINKMIAMRRSEFFESLLDAYPANNIITFPNIPNISVNIISKTLELLKNPLDINILSLDDSEIEGVWIVSDYLQIFPIIDVLKYRLIEYYTSFKFFYKYGKSIPIRNSLPGEDMIKSMIIFPLPVGIISTNSEYFSIDYSPDGKYFACNDAGEIKLFDSNIHDNPYIIYKSDQTSFKSGVPLDIFDPGLSRPARYMPISYSPNGIYLAFSRYAGVVVVLDISSFNDKSKGSFQGKIVRKYDCSKLIGDAFSLAFNKTGTKLAAANEGIVIWDLLSNSLQPSQTLLSRATNVKFILNDKYMVADGRESLEIFKLLDNGVYSGVGEYSISDSQISDDERKLAILITNINIMNIEKLNFMSKISYGDAVGGVKLIRFTDDAKLWILTPDQTGYIVIKVIDVTDSVANLPLYYKKLVPGHTIGTKVFRQHYFQGKLSPDKTKLLMDNLGSIKIVRLDIKFNFNQFILVLNILSGKIVRYTPYWAGVYNTLPDDVKKALPVDLSNLLE